MKRVVIALLFLSSIVSCTKDKEEETRNKKTNYTPMSVGNYWVYKNFLIDTMGNETETSRIDTVTITRTENIGAYTYYVFEGTYYTTPVNKPRILYKLRGSSGYLVDTSGLIHFAHNDYSDSLDHYCLKDRHDANVYCASLQMKEGNFNISTPAGTFSAKKFNRYITLYEPYLPDDVPNPRNWDIYYADGVGKIMETYFFSTQKDHYELRLDSYHVK